MGLGPRSIDQTPMSRLSRAVRLRLEDRSHAAEGRRRATDLARQAGWSEARRSDLQIVITELTQNVLRHAGRGDLFIGHSCGIGGSAIDVLALDRGPGIVSIKQALTDGYSTGGTPGTGLGAVHRLSDEFDAHSSAGAGTAVLARLRANRRQATRPWMEFGGFAVPRPGEQQCGDAWACRLPDGDGADDASSLDLLIADGLGHGPDAATASSAAVDVFVHGPDALPARLQEMHGRLRSTRGAAVAMTRVHRRGGVIEHLGAGNIAGLLTTGDRPVNLLTRHGTVGLATPRAEPMRYNLGDRNCLVLHSDGLASRWRPEAYASLWGRHCALLAGLLIRDHARGTDDVTVVVARRSTGPDGRPVTGFDTSGR